MICTKKQEGRGSFCYPTTLAKLGKVQLFLEGHKNVRIRPYGFEIYLVNVKTMRMIVQIFVTFSEKLNFNTSAEFVLIQLMYIYIENDHKY